MVASSDSLHVFSLFRAPELQQRAKKAKGQLPRSARRSPHVPPLVPSTAAPGEDGDAKAAGQQAMPGYWTNEMGERL